MLTARPLTESFSLPWRHDPAFDSERFESPEAYARAYETACETQRWDELLRPGERATLFVFRPLKGHAMRALMPQGRGSGITTQMCALAFRLALMRVDNFEIPDAPKLDRASDRDFPELGPMVRVEFVDYLDALCVAAGHPFGSIVNELGAEVITRCVVPSPR